MQIFIYSNRSFPTHTYVSFFWLNADFCFEEQVSLTQKQIAN